MCTISVFAHSGVPKVIAEVTALMLHATWWDSRQTDAQSISIGSWYLVLINVFLWCVMVVIICEDVDDEEVGGLPTIDVSITSEM